MKVARGSAHSYRLWAPAKVNLLLRVVGRREDGYHLLESVVVPISVFDRVTVRLNQTQNVTVRLAATHLCTAVPAGPENVAFAAARKFFAALSAKSGPCPSGADIEIEKYRPVGAGLGGGSSDAAAVLLAINSLLGSPLRPDDLHAVAAEVGADVPCLLFGGPTRVTGIGEVVCPIDIPQPMYVVVCHDGKPLLTRDVFRCWDASLTPQNELSTMQRSAGRARWSGGLLHNDLERAAMLLRPEIRGMKEKLQELGVIQSAMSGSGSAVFGICATMEEARRVATALRNAGYWAEAARMLQSAWAPR